MILFASEWNSGIRTREGKLSLHPDLWPPSWESVTQNKFFFVVQKQPNLFFPFKPMEWMEKYPIIQSAGLCRRV